MTHIEVKSSSLKSLAYDEATGNMTARFRCPHCKGEGAIQIEGFSGPYKESCGRCEGSGHTGDYDHANVPFETYSNVLNAESSGKAYNELIRGKYNGKKRN